MVSTTYELKHRIITPKRGRRVGLICWLLRFPWFERIYALPDNPITRMRLRRGRPAVKVRP